ncbi:uncharacterized protein LOC128673414 [Plodia interpunctella]|uniref:uncharacterized protein LOC128673414 n=1 Tax=Plodia interpunctella TaxID=58824 RepID=UPI002368D5F9|nr:uncharacterized protein LOC128673414 [Plodia interpunctella]
MCYRYWLCFSMCLVSLWEEGAGHPGNLVWSGGPVHMECEHSADYLTHSGQHVKDNVIAIKAVTYSDEVYVITPRFKRGVMATVWQVVRGRAGPELLAFPSLRPHTVGDCDAIQNAIDIHLDHIGILWILDSGTVESLESPRCTCPPKVVVVSILLRKVTRNIDLSSLTMSTSLLQSIVVEYELGAKPFIYISDAARGAILVHDVTSGSEWSVLACPPAAGLQLALVRQTPATMLVMVRLHYQGLLELDTASLRRKSSLAPLRVFGENSKRVSILGFDSHHVYLRHRECSDVLVWNTKEAYNASNLISIHSPGPRLTPTSVSADPLKQLLIVLDSDYGDTIHTNLPTYHRITYIGQI